MCISRILLFLIFLWPMLAPSFRAQEPPQDAPIKIETTLVSVPVIVSDRQGRYVANLKQEHFTLYQDRVKQKIAFFAASEEPVNLAILLDTSQSAFGALDEIKAAGVVLVRQLRPKDQATVIVFDAGVHELCPLTQDRRMLESAIQRAEIGRRLGTKLNDAVVDAIERSFKSVKGRKAILLLTDGKDAGSNVSSRDLLERVEESDTLIYPIFYSTGPVERGGFRLGGRMARRIERRNEQALVLMETLADTSAGRFYKSEVTDLKATFGRILEELRFQYRLGFYPEASGGEGALHQLSVTINRTDVVVRSRRNYRNK
jgi:Ca-activated chloride channel homolog